MKLSIVRRENFSEQDEDIQIRLKEISAEAAEITKGVLAVLASAENGERDTQAVLTALSGVIGTTIVMTSHHHPELDADSLFEIVAQAIKNQIEAVSKDVRKRSMN